jgi:hypothetical protein
MKNNSSKYELKQCLTAAVPSTELGKTDLNHCSVCGTRAVVERLNNIEMDLKEIGCWVWTGLIWLGKGANGKLL